MLKRRDKGRKIKKWFLIILAGALIFPLIYVFLVKFEGRAPVVQLDLKSSMLPADFDISGYAEDRKSGIRSLWVGISQKEKTAVLLDKRYASAGWGQKGVVCQFPIRLHENTKKLKLSDGSATLRIVVRDYSWRNWWGGNQTILEKEIFFDTQAPVVSVLSTQHNLSRGGSGLVIYRLSESCPRSGVSVGNDFFPGYSGGFNDPEIYLAFFAVPFDYEESTDMLVKAVDPAGNEAKTGFYYYIRKNKFKTDTINISDDFLNWKLPELSGAEGFPVEKSSKDQFVFINEVLRKRNNQTIVENGQHTESRIFWEGTFGRLPNSARRANFADQRAYKYHGDVISHAVHMGIDLASVKHAAIPAANRGKVVFAGYVGIYGNLVCIDHGFGVMSLYGHLSSIAVKKDEMVESGEIIGNTGTSGLAGGDHLHFGMFIDHVFVNPVEWWDAMWIKNNITDKIKMVQAMNR